MGGIHHGVGSRESLLGEGYGTGVQVNDPIGLLEHRDVGVAVHEDVPPLHLHEVAGQEVAVDQIAAITVEIGDFGIGQAEAEKAFVDPRIAIALDGHDYRGEAIEDRAGPHRVVILGDAVARSVIEKIPQQDQFVGFVVEDDLLKPFHGQDPPVDVRGDDDAQKWFTSGKL